MIEESGQLEKNLSVLIELIDIGICSEIGNYKQRRKVDYVSNLREIAKKSIKALGLYGKLVKLPL